MSHTRGDISRIPFKKTALLVNFNHYFGADGKRFLNGLGGLQRPQHRATVKTRDAVAGTSFLSTMVFGNCGAQQVLSDRFSLSMTQCRK